MQQDFLKTEKQWGKQTLAAKKARRHKIARNIFAAIIVLGAGLLIVLSFTPHYRPWHPTNTPMNIPEPTVPPSHAKKAPHAGAQPRQDPIAHHDL